MLDGVVSTPRGCVIMPSRLDPPLVEAILSGDEDITVFGSIKFKAVHFRRAECDDTPRDKQHPPTRTLEKPIRIRHDTSTEESSSGSKATPSFPLHRQEKTKRRTKEDDSVGSLRSTPKRQRPASQSKEFTSNSTRSSSNRRLDEIRQKTRRLRETRQKTRTPCPSTPIKVTRADPPGISMDSTLRSSRSTASPMKKSKQKSSCSRRRPTSSDIDFPVSLTNANRLNTASEPTMVSSPKSSSRGKPDKSPKISNLERPEAIKRRRNSKKVQELCLYSPTLWEEESTATSDSWEANPDVKHVKDGGQPLKPPKKTKSSKPKKGPQSSDETGGRTHLAEKGEKEPSPGKQGSQPPKSQKKAKPSKPSKPKRPHSSDETGGGTDSPVKRRESATRNVNTPVSGLKGDKVPSTGKQGVHPLKPQTKAKPSKPKRLQSSDDTKRTQSSDDTKRTQSSDDTKRTQSSDDIGGGTTMNAITPVFGEKGDKVASAGKQVLSPTKSGDDEMRFMSSRCALFARSSSHFRPRSVIPQSLSTMKNLGGSFHSRRLSASTASLSLQSSELLATSQPFDNDLLETKVDLVVSSKKQVHPRAWFVLAHPSKQKHANGEEAVLRSTMEMVFFDTIETTHVTECA